MGYMNSNIIIINYRSNYYNHHSYSVHRKSPFIINFSHIGVNLDEYGKEYLSCIKNIIH